MPAPSQVTSLAFCLKYLLSVSFLKNLGNENFQQHSKNCDTTSHKGIMACINTANCRQCYDRVQGQNIWSPSYQWWLKNFVWWYISYSGFRTPTVSPSHLWDRGTTSTEVKFNNKPLLNLIFFSYIIPGMWMFTTNSTIGSNKTWMSTGKDSHCKVSENTDLLFTENLNIFLAARYPNNFQSPQLTVSLWNCSHYIMQYLDS